MTAFASNYAFTFAPDPLTADIDEIHRGTAIYTAAPEIECLLDQLDWPNQGKRLLDPGAGNGGFLVAALARLPLSLNDVETAAHRVRGYEFHAGAAETARQAVQQHLQSRGWSVESSTSAARRIVETKDYLLSPVPVEAFDVIAANPPYWRILQHLPPESRYRCEFENAVPQHVRSDLLYAYLQRSVDIIAKGGKIGLITADRWLLNKGSATLREKIGALYSVSDIRRLDAESCFYRPKSRRRGSPARVHPVSLILTPGTSGRLLSAAPFQIEQMPAVQGRPLAEIADIRLAPWLGPDGIFVVDHPRNIPTEHLVPCIEPTDIDVETGTIRKHRWAIATSKNEPAPAVIAHIHGQYHRMPTRGRRSPQWLPPESFHGKLPLTEDAVLIPRIAKKLTPIRLPAGTMPINHNLVVVAGIPADKLIAMLSDPLVSQQANILALRLENGYHSYTATLLRELIIPERHFHTNE